MANISITNCCNLECPYCFASKHIHDEDKYFITLEQFNKILTFLESDDSEKIGLIGGEPILHPNLDILLQNLNSYCEKNQKKWVIFSNGLNVDKILPYIEPYGSCLININNPITIGEKNWDKLLNNLSLIKEKNYTKYFSLGINLYFNMPNYEFIFKLAQQYGYTNLRVSLVAPNKKVNKDIYYSQGKMLFLNFAKKAKENNITIGLDCNNVPICYYNTQELKTLNGFVTGWRNYCEPVIDIFPNYTASVCFGVYHPFSLKGFNSIQDFKNFLHSGFLNNKVRNNYINLKCQQCDKSKNFTCQGGCLFFSGLE